MMELLIVPLSDKSIIIKDAMNEPFFSIIIATHKRPKILARAIESILLQTYTNCKIIIVSDAVDVETYEIAYDLMRPDDVFIQRNGIAGPAASRNIALTLATGSHVIFLDDDDAFDPHFLHDLAKLITIENDQKTLYVNCNVIDLAIGVERILINLSFNEKEDLWVKNFIPNNCIIYPRKLAQTIKYEENLAYEDWDYLLSAASQSDLLHLPISGPIIYKNSGSEIIHRGESNQNKLLECYTKIYQKHLPPNQNVLFKRKNLFNSIGIDITSLGNEFRNE
jgi:glycosyltransferase involved in cell wall biosynthesis